MKVHALHHAGIATILLLLLASPAALQAQFTCTTNNGAITITGYTGPGGEITIPGVLDGLPVVSIGDNAFGYNGTLLSVTIPNGVTSIGNWAFNMCSNLNSAALPGSLVDIGGWAFQGCTALHSVAIGNSVTDIEGYAFSGCSSLTNVTIPNSVLSIGDGAFLRCSNLTCVTIGKGVTAIGNWAFGTCPALTAITVDPLNSSYSSLDGVLFNKSQTVLVVCPETIGGWYTIPNSVTNIEAYAFANCRRLTTIMMGRGLTSIGDGAFQVCSHLTSVYFQGNAPSLGSLVFFCYALDQLPLPPIIVYDPAIAYYPAGTTGWGSYFGGLPTSSWVPPGMQASDPGVRTNRFGFTVVGIPNIPFAIEACTNLANPIWQPFQICTLTNGSIYFSDPTWTNYPARLYRIRSP